MAGRARINSESIYGVSDCLMLIEVIRDNIERGTYPLDKRLPSERKLAAELHAPQSQVRKALQTLVTEGYLECFRNNGYFIKKNHPRSGTLYQVALCVDQASLASISGEDFYTGSLFNKAVAYDINLAVFTIPPEISERDNFFSDLIRRSMEGVICFPHLIENLTPGLLEFKKRSIPFIFWDYSPFHGVFPYVGVDHYQSCFDAAGILARHGGDVTYIGFAEKEQNERKRDGFMDGARLFGLKTAEPVFIPYAARTDQDFLYNQLNRLPAGKTYFTSTRTLTQILVGSMMDKGHAPGRDYRLLGTDTLSVTRGSASRLDCLTRDSDAITRALLSMVRDMIKKPSPIACDYRVSMKYVPGQSLA